MLFADTMAIFFVVLGVLIAFPSLWLLHSALFPDFVKSNRALLERSLWKPFLLAIPFAAASVFFIALVGKLPGSFGQISGVLSFSLIMLFANAGVSGLASMLGARLASPVDLERPWKGTLRGGLVLAFSCLLPLLGWFIVMPCSVLLGLGASLITVFGALRKKKGKAIESEESTTAGNVKLAIVGSDLASAAAVPAAPAASSEAIRSEASL